MKNAAQGLKEPQVAYLPNLDLRPLSARRGINRDSADNLIRIVAEIELAKMWKSIPVHPDRETYNRRHTAFRFPTGNGPEIIKGGVMRKRGRGWKLPASESKWL